MLSCTVAGTADVAPCKLVATVEVKFFWAIAHVIFALELSL